MEIRKLTAADWEAYRSVRLEALEMAPEAFAADLTEQQGRPEEYWRSRASSEQDAFVLGAFASDGRIVGMAGLRQERVRKVRHKGVIWGVYVSPWARGRGVARGILSALLTEAQQLPGLEQITLSVVTENLPAKGLYTSLGFTAYGTERRALKIGERYVDEDHMVLFL